MAKLVATTTTLLLLHQFQVGGCFQHPPSPLKFSRSNNFSRRGGSADNIADESSISATIAASTTDADASLHHTLQRLGVRGIASPPSNTRGVSVCTTDLSVAGRGAFWSPSAITSAIPSQQSASATILQGDVLAFIPKTSILTICNPAPLSSSGDGDGGDDDGVTLIMEALSSLSASKTTPWPVAFTLYVWAASLHDEVFRDWIDSFFGPDPPICPPKKMADDAENNEQNYYDEAVQNLVSMAQVPKETAKEAIAARYEAYARDWQAAQEWMQDNSHYFATGCIIEESEFAKLYSILISRTANLGPVYETLGVVRGVIPLHDMLNHPPPDVEHNVELFTVGDIRGLMPEEEVQRLVGMVLLEDQQHDNNASSSVDDDDNTKGSLLLDDRDVLLVARREILPGEELFLSYRNNRARPMIDEKERAWTTLQYGFYIQ